MKFTFQKFIEASKHFQNEEEIFTLKFKKIIKSNQIYTKTVKMSASSVQFRKIKYSFIALLKYFKELLLRKTYF